MARPGHRAEESIVDFVNYLNNHEPMNKIPGLSYWVNGKKVHNPNASPIKNLDDLPFPNFALIKGYEVERRVYPIQCSRGCPYNCEYCSVTLLFGRRVRFRSVKNVMDELERAEPKAEPKVVFFCDDNFFVNPNYVEELLREKIISVIGE